jgi:SAM-dependent methyltransferase
MSSAEFDSVAADYRSQHAASLRLSGEEPDFFAHYKARDVRQIVERAGMSPRRILDFGSGIGNAIAPLREEFAEAQLTCLDVSAESLDHARRNHGDVAIYRHYDGTHIPNDVGQFDIVFTACVFHHIPEEQHVSLLGQIRNLLAPGGRFILFEHNPWNPATRHAVSSCPFDANAVLISAPEMARRLRLAGFSQCDTRYRLFFPAALAWLRPLERFLTGLPLGAQYCLSAS